MSASGAVPDLFCHHSASTGGLSVDNNDDQRPRKQAKEAVASGLVLRLEEPSLARQDFSSPHRCAEGAARVYSDMLLHQDGVRNT